MPSKNPTRDDVEQRVQQLDALLDRYDRDFPRANQTSPLPQAVEAHGHAPGVGSGHVPGDPFFQNEIEIESKPAPQPPRKRGQRTKEGQVIASRNSIKHGIMSSSPVVGDFETIEDWERYRDGIVSSIAPQGPLEENLAHRLATILWRLDRVTRYETASIKLEVLSCRDEHREDAEAAKKLGRPPEDPDVLMAQIDYNALPGDETAQKLIKYETHLHRQSIQLLHEIEALQARRNGERTPLARLDISGPPP